MICDFKNQNAKLTLGYTNLDLWNSKRRQIIAILRTFYKIYCVFYKIVLFNPHNDFY
jgi:hypothetical protein